MQEPPPQLVGPAAVAVLTHRLAKTRARGKARRRVCRTVIDGVGVVSGKEFGKSPATFFIFFLRLGRGFNTQAHNAEGGVRCRGKKKNRSSRRICRPSTACASFDKNLK